MKIEKQNEYSWKVESESDPHWDYDVIHKTDGSWYCTCESYKWRTKECKHIRAVKEQDKQSNPTLDTLREFVQSKKGFTCMITEDGLLPYKPKYNRYIVAYKTLTAITKTNQWNFKPAWDEFIKSETYLVGGWYDEKAEAYLIEVCESYADLSCAISFAKTYEQKYIYDIHENKSICVADYNKLKELKNKKKHEEAGLNYCRSIYHSLQSDIAKEACKVLFDTHYYEIKALNRRIELLKRDGGL